MSFASFSSCTTAFTTVGTSFSNTFICEPNASASTERSIKLTDASESTLCATFLIPSACRSLSFIISFTVAPINCTLGKERIGIGFFIFAALTSDSHLCIFVLIVLILPPRLFPSLFSSFLAQEDIQDLL